MADPTILRAMSTPADKGAAAPLSVSDVNRIARDALEGSLGHCAVVGEISNLARPASGHVYFSLKDSKAQLRCAFFRQRQRGLSFKPENGDEVIATGKISLYEPRGDYQLIVEHLAMAGSGALQKQFEALRARLEAEGLFAESRKRPLPALPRRIGVVTSPSGAAVQDILRVLARRFPQVPVRIYPSAVQGERAAGELCAALDAAALDASCDVIIVARGGGSLEDLWPFNEEPVARAIAESPIPIISGVGHETDLTIADLVADARAPTPSGAAEIAVPDWRTFAERERRAQAALQRAFGRRLDRYRQRVDVAVRALAAHNPVAALRLRREKLQRLRLALAATLNAARTDRASALARLRQRLGAASPAALLNTRRTRLATLTERLPALAKNRLANDRRRLAILARTLDAVSPLATLGRGYALVTDSASGQVVRDADATQLEQTLKVRLARGALTTRVIGKDD